MCKEEGLIYNLKVPCLLFLEKSLRCLKHPLEFLYNFLVQRTFVFIKFSICSNIIFKLYPTKTMQISDMHFNLN